MPRNVKLPSITAKTKACLEYTWRGVGSMHLEALMMVRASRFVVACCLLTGATGLCLAQNTSSGDIRGTVTDASGAVVPGATVTVTNTDTGVTEGFVTNSDGIYDTVSTPPGNYEIAFTKAGFKKFIRRPVTLDVGVITVDARLAVGVIEEEVVVAATTPLLKTETSEQSTTLDSKTMTQLPQVGQDWSTFAILLPGTSGAPSAFGWSPGVGVAVNGNLPFYSNFLADGASTTNPHSSDVNVSTFETVSEVQVSTSSFSAEYGIGGAVFNQISKGGTNKWHGAAYEYFQNDALNARSYFDPANQHVPYLRYNNYGGSVGGPILRNKLFFYFNLDKGMNDTSTTGFVTVPTVAMRSGDFSAPGLPTIYDPSTTTCAGPGSINCTRTAFAGNIITTPLDPVAKALEAYYPLPNRPGLVNNFYYQVKQPNPSIRIFGRLDYDVSPKNRVTFSITARDNPAFYVNEDPCPVNCTAEDVSSYAAQVSDVWTISPTTVNEFRFGFNRQGNWYTPASVGKGYPQKVGLQYAKADIFPDISISGSDGCCDGLYASTNVIYLQNSFDPSDAVTMIRGKHILHFGGELLAAQDNSTPWGNKQAGEFGFSGVYTQQAGVSGSGSGYADFLLGQVQSWSANNAPASGARQKSPQLFIQDDIKLRSNLTINLGLRYQIQKGWSDVKNHLAMFDPTILNTATGTYGAMWFAGQTSRTTLQAPIYDIFLPRAGFAWSPKANTTIRGGFGIYSYNWSLDAYGQGIGFGANSTGNVSDQTNGIAPFLLLSGNGTDLQTGRPLPYLAASTSPTAYNGQGGLSYNPYHTPVAKIYQWSLGTQREFGRGVMAELAYVGSHGAHLSFPVDLNQVPNNLLSPNDNPGSRPFPQFQSLNGDKYNAISNYNALQAQIQKRLSGGLSFSANYTWSHFLDERDSSGFHGAGGNQFYQDAYEPGVDYASSNFDIRNMFKGSAVYQLPVGKGKRFLNSNTLLDMIVGGWQASTTGVLQGGNPFTVTYSATNNSYAQSGSAYFASYPNVVGDPRLSHPTINAWFNLAAFSHPAPGTFGNSRRNTVVGPGLSDVNFSLGKSFALREGIALQLRADASNVLNHPSFGHPDSNFDDPVDLSQPNRPSGAGTISSTTIGGRNLQLGARLSF